MTDIDHICKAIDADPTDVVSLKAAADWHEERGNLLAAVMLRVQARVEERMAGLMLDGRANPSEFVRRYTRYDREMTHKSGAVAVVAKHDDRVEISGPSWPNSKRSQWHIIVSGRYLSVETSTEIGWLPTWEFWGGQGWTDEMGNDPPDAVFAALEAAARRIERERAERELLR
jgi:hypothetical protein